MNQLFFENHLHFDKVDSTNDELLNLVKNNDIKEGFVLSASFQNSGRGQRQKRWDSEFGQNLLFSIFLCPRLSVFDHFKLIQFVSLGISDFLSSFIETGFEIKWPNDILFNGKKIAGVLVENKVSGSIITQSVLGIGLNVNQTQFNLYDREATSLSLLLNRRFCLDDLKKRLLLSLQNRYRSLYSNKLHLEYENILYLRGISAEFMIKNRVKRGIIKCVSKSGELQMQIDGKFHSFGHKDIQYHF